LTKNWKKSNTQGNGRRKEVNNGRCGSEGSMTGGISLKGGGGSRKTLRKQRAEQASTEGKHEVTVQVRNNGTTRRQGPETRSGQRKRKEKG